MKSISGIVIFYIILLLLPVAALKGQVPPVYNNPPFHRVNSTNILNDLHSPMTDDKLPVVKEDWIINEFCEDKGEAQDLPSIAVDGSGNYGVAWLDKRDGNFQVYVQFYNAYDEKIGKNIRVSERPLNSRDLIYPQISCNPQGDFAVAWSGYVDGRILAVRFNSRGEKISGIFQIGEDETHQEIAVALNKNGDLLAVWNKEGAVAKLFDSFGNALSGEIILSYSMEAYQHSKVVKNSVTADGKGNFYVVWDEENSIKFVKIDSAGSKIGSAVVVAQSEAELHDAQIIINGDGIITFTWKFFSESVTGYGFNFRSFSEKNNDFITDIFWGDGDSMNIASKNIAPAWQNSFNFLYTHDGELFCQTLTIDGQLTGNWIALQLLSNYSEYIYGASISKTSGDYFYTVFSINDFHQYKYGGGDIFVKKFNSNYNPVFEARKVNDDKFSSRQNDPLVCYNNQGYSIVVWQDSKNLTSDIFARVYDNKHHPLTGNIKINEYDYSDYSYWWSYLKIPKKVAALTDGSFLVLFQPVPDTLYLQKINSQGIKTGKNKAVISISGWIFDFAIGTNDQNEFLLSCYYKYNDPDTTGLINNPDDGNHKALIRKFNREMQPISEEIEVINSDNYFAANRKLYTSIDENLNVFSVWAENAGYNHEREKIFGLLINQYGQIEMDTVVADVEDTDKILALSNRLDQYRNFIVSWLDLSSVWFKRFYPGSADSIFVNKINCSAADYVGPQIIKFQNKRALVGWTCGPYAYVYFMNDFTKTNQKKLLHYFKFQDDCGVQLQNANSSAYYNGELFFVYESNKNGGTSYDIWGNIQKTEYMDFDEEPYRRFENNDVLYANFPNPFNDRTDIAFDIFSYHHVKICIYDVLGRQVRVLLDRDMEKGYYKTEFDAGNLPSGVYFCRLEAFDTKVIKMLLVK